MNIASELAQGKTLTTAQIAQRHKVHPSTPFRWISKGMPTPRGETIKLEAIRMGKKYLTTEAALERFFSRLSAAPVAEQAQASGPSAAEIASARLAEMGA